MTIKYWQRSRKPGAKQPPNTRCCTRGTKWGNSHRVGDIYRGVSLSVTDAVNLYKVELETKLQSGELSLDELTGYDYLSCWCSVDAEACHVRDVLIPLVNEYL